MKQLRKIQLKDAVVISDSEMRQIRGGIEDTTGITCEKNATDDGCKDTESTCYVGALKGKCVWSTGISQSTGEIVKMCNCKWTNPN